MRNTRKGVDTPLAEWRVYATATELQQRRNRPREARQYRQQSAAVINRLADSLDEESAIRQSLLTHRTVRSILHRS